MTLSFSCTACVALLLLFSISTNAQNVTSDVADDAELEGSCDKVRFCVKRLDRGEECDILPVRERSKLENVAPGSYNLTKLRTGVWVFYDGTHQAMILKMDRRLAVVDFPDGSVPALLAATEEILDGTFPKRVDMVYSHSHYDHIGGATRYHDYITETYPNASILIWGTVKTGKKIEASESQRAIKPTVFVSSRGRTLTPGPGLDVKMSIIGGHSTSQDLLLYIPRFGDEASVVMVVDIVFPRWAPFLNLAITTDVRRYIKVHEEILKFDFDFFLGGHVHIGNANDVKRNLRFTRDLVRIAGKAIEKVTVDDFLEGGLGKVGDPNAPEFGNVWYAAIDVVRKLQVDYCYRNVLAIWGCTLAGLDITLRSHCFTAVTYNLVDV